MKSLKLGVITSALLCGSLALGAAEFSAKGKSTEKIRFNGRIHAQFDNLSTDDSGAADPATKNNFLVRRAYFGIKGTLVNGVTGEINGNFASGTGELDKALITIKPMDDTKVSFGYDKIPVGYEETTSSSKIKTVERSIVTRYFTEQYDLGARMEGAFIEGKAAGFYYEGAITNGVQGSQDGKTADTNNQLALSGRVGLKGKSDSFKYNVGAYGVNFGDETKAATEGTLVYGAFADLDFGIVNLQGEVISGDFDNGATDSSPLGFHIIPTISLNDSFDVVLRYASIDGDGAKVDISDTFRRAADGAAGKYEEAQSYYIGGNWYIDGNNLKLTFGYEMADYEDAAGDSDVSGFRARLQILF